jgi:ketosteroid isomerase-like protein
MEASVAQTSRNGEEAQAMRTLLIGGALGLLVVSLAACGGGSTTSASEQAMQRQADLYAIAQIEKKWHKATSSQNIDLMMSLWAPNATFTVGPGETFTGQKQIRRFWLAAPVFQPENHWVSETPAYKIRITVNGDRGTLYFECHYVDAKTRKVVAVTAADEQVARINERWLITNNVGASPILSP